MDTTPSETAAPVTLTGRLHPFSWLFILMTQLRTVALPLLALLLFGTGTGWELWGAAGAGVLALYSVVYSFGFRYELGASEIVVREGIFFRTERHVPYERIQNVVQKRNLLHRAFGVCELRLESAGTGKSEARMSVIKLLEAGRIERVLRGHSASTPEAAATSLLALGWRELVKLGLVSNRGVIAIGAAFALWWQFEPWEYESVHGVFRTMGGALSGWQDWGAGPLTFVAGALLAALLFVVVLKAISIAAAIVQFHGFTLTRDDERVATVAGLLTRGAASARRDKIQRLVYAEGWLARRFGIRQLTCDVAAGAADDASESSRLKWLAPIATPSQIGRIVAETAPGLDIAGLEWRPLHPRAWRRMAKPPLVLWSIVSIGPAIMFGWGVVAIWVLLMVYTVLEARGRAKFAGYAITGEVFAYRAGWLTRRWAVARITKGQSVQVSHALFDRRAGMANVALDTAGASSMGIELKVPYLPESEARELAARIRAAM
jgi:putative membrane protein